ncbi:MAG: MFS transporter [Aquisalimonadaceae bacterium]
MTSLERRATAGLASIFGLRMFGLFLVLPVFSIYGAALGGATPVLIGLAIGVYGLTQALLQIPMGFASDRFGRKPVIVLGLLVFAAGSVLAGMSDHIFGVIAGRALQGAGAIAAAVMALASDLTEPRYRTRVMAFIGMSVGLSFLAALMLGPVIAAGYGLSGLFWFTAVLALAAIAVLYLVVPDAPSRPRQADARPIAAYVGEVLRNGDLLRLNTGIFTLHFVMTATFIAVPLVLLTQLELPVERHWQVYVPVLLLSVVGLVPAIIIGERYHAQRLITLLAVAALVAATFLLAATVHSGWLFLVPLWLYFAAFNILEASLPALVSRYAPASFKGTALGVYSTCQFAGAFAGGLFGGVVLGLGGTWGVFLLCGAVTLPWLAVTGSLRPLPVTTPLETAD